LMLYSLLFLLFFFFFFFFFFLRESRSLVLISQRIFRQESVPSSYIPPLFCADLSPPNFWTIVFRRFFFCTPSVLYPTHPLSTKGLSPPSVLSFKALSSFDYFTPQIGLVVSLFFFPRGFRGPSVTLQPLNFPFIAGTIF